MDRSTAKAIASKNSHIVKGENINCRDDRLDGGIPETCQQVWDSKRLAALAYHERCGRWPSVISSDRDVSALGRWINRQRYRARDGSLHSERRAALDATPGWLWSGRSAKSSAEPSDKASIRESRWQAKYTAAVAFHKENGRWPSTTSLIPSEADLGWWVTCQRRRAKTSPVRKAILDATPGWIWHGVMGSMGRYGETKKRTDERKWQAKHKAAIEFHSVNGRWPSTTSANPEEAKLGRWVSSQRRSATINRLSHERRNILDATPGWLWTGSQVVQRIDDLRMNARSAKANARAAKTSK